MAGVAVGGRAAKEFVVVMEVNNIAMIAMGRVSLTPKTNFRLILFEVVI
jgi:hypothetical protein